MRSPLRQVGIHHIDRPARRLLAQLSQLLFAAPAPGAIAIRINGDEIDVVGLGGLAASRRAEQSHLTHPGPANASSARPPARADGTAPVSASATATVATLPARPSAPVAGTGAGACPDPGFAAPGEIAPFGLVAPDRAVLPIPDRGLMTAKALFRW